MKALMKKFLTIVSPKLETKINYYMSFRKKLDLNNPKTINEKLLWLKLYTYNNNDLVTMCADKYKVRDYISNFNDINVAKLYGVYDSPDIINYKDLPNQFVIKCNHGCGYNIIVKDKSELNIEETNNTLKKWLNTDFWKIAAEIQYKYINKKIIVEEFLGDVKTYKFYCFNGEPKIMYISNDEWNEKGFVADKYIDFFDIEFNHINCTLGEHPNYDKPIKKPKIFEEMVRVSKQLSKDFPFVRVDLYEVRDKIYLSELTFIPTAGYMKISPDYLLNDWGNMLDISNEMINKRHKKIN